MIADVANPDFMQEWAPCKVFDATGAEIPHCVWADTETGEAVVLMQMWQADGKIRWTFDGSGEYQPCTERKQFPAPLRLERMGA